MTNTTSLAQVEEPKLQAIVQGNIDYLEEKELPAGTVHKAAAHRAMLMEWIDTAATLLAFPEEGAVRLLYCVRRSFRHYGERIMEALVCDAESTESLKDGFRIIKSSVKEKQEEFLEALYQRYLYVEEAVLRLVPEEELNHLDTDSAVLLTAGLDSCSIVRGQDRPKLKCYTPKNPPGGTQTVEARPYGPHRFTIWAYDGILQRYSGPGGDLVIPEGVTQLQWNAFEGCTGLTSMVIPDSVTSIGGHCFKDCSNLRSVTIPEGVREIGFYAFQNCSSLTSLTIPDSVEKIDGYAFSGCSSLTDLRLSAGLIKLDRGLFCGCTSLTGVTIPESVAEIDWNVFENCSSLASLTIPDSVKKIGSQAFRGCSALADENGFVVVRGTLYDYVGPGGDVAVPDGVTALDREVFCERSMFAGTRREGDARITGVVIPEGVTSIGDRAFAGCSALKSLSLPQSLKHIDDYAFSTSLSDSGWPLRELRLPQGCALEKDTFDYVVKKVMRLNADFFAVPEKLPPYYAEFFTMAEPEPHAVAMCRLYQTGKTWQKPIEDAIAAVDQDALIRELCAVVAEMKDENAAGALVSFTLDYLDRLSFGQMQEIYAVLKQNGFRALKKLALDEDFQARWLENIAGKTQAEEAAPLSPIEQLVKDNWKVTAQTKKLKGIVKDGVKRRDSEEISSPEAVIFVINDYASQLELPTYLSMYDSLYAECKFSENADRVAAALDPEALQALLEELAYKEEYNKDGFILALGRYGSGAQISRLVAQMKDWETWYKYAATGRRNIIIARGALMLSDTREAMLALDKSGHLGAYAAMRGEDADTLRDTVLSEFGFDAEGKKSYSLGANTLQVSLDRDLKLVLFDCGAGKTVKSVPKKNADPALYEAAKADIAELKKNIRRVVKSRGQKLFSAFLSGRAQEAESWKTSYLGNPVLKAVAELIVWEQDGKTFTVSPAGPADSFGQPYTLSDKPVRVAYPSEMDREELSRWQTLFLAEKRKQPFEQIWEPVIDPAGVKPDRYKDCELNIYKFSGKEQHGIGTYGYTDYTEVFGFSLTDCKLKAACSAWRFVHGMTDDAYYTLGDFTLEKYTRVSNHIMGLLDRWTVSERVLKDEIDLEPVLASFTLAQIMELIELASANGKTNSLAVLMEYKNNRFPEADPLAEFTLD